MHLLKTISKLAAFRSGVLKATNAGSNRLHSRTAPQTPENFSILLKGHKPFQAMMEDDSVFLYVKIEPT